MKKVWNAKYRNGTGSARVYGTDVDDAKKSAYALYTYTGAMSTKNFGIDEIVESVELAEDQVMMGNAVQQQVEYTADDPEWDSLGFDKIIAGGMEFDVKSRKVKPLDANSVPG